MNRLTELGVKHGTDKATYHGFTDFYFPWFDKLVNPDVLEVGIYQGASIRMMDEFFGNATILGLDIVNKLDFGRPNIEVKLCDQSKPNELLVCTEGRSFDIIIDDGSHVIAHQLITFGALFPKVKVGGIYILEDIHTSFRTSYNPNGESPNTYDVVYRLSKKLPVSTRFIQNDVMEKLTSRIRGVHIFQRDKNVYDDSMTAVIEL